MELTLHRDSFVKGFLSSIAGISDNARIQCGSIMESIVNSADNTAILWAKYQTATETETHFNLPNIKKITRLLSALEEEFSLELHTNKLVYKGKPISFEYFLLDDAYIAIPPLNKEKIKSLETQVQCAITGEQLLSILKYSSVATDTEKVYFTVKGNELYAEINDKEKHNVTNVSLMITDEIQNAQDFSIPFLMSGFRLLSCKAEDQMVFSFNIPLKLGVLQYKPSSDVTLKYIFSGLVK